MYLQYFLIAGIAGVNPHMGTLGSAVWARFSVQSGLAYELDTRQTPSNWSTGYWALGTKAPGRLPQVSETPPSRFRSLSTLRHRSLASNFHPLTACFSLRADVGPVRYRGL